jgi:Skp family chaperone for outer membrane proteins
MNSAKKAFDAVEMMRAIRDDLSRQIDGMSLKEELEWLAKQKLDHPLLQRLRAKAAQHANAVDAAVQRR